MKVQNLIRESRAPKVGIFWIYQKSGRPYILSFQEEAQEVPAVGGFKDTALTHFRKWTEANKIIKSQGDYTETPRGRVLYDENRRKYIILSSTEVSQDDDLVTRIMRDFSLPTSNTVISVDEHYNGDDD